MRSCLKNMDSMKRYLTARTEEQRTHVVTRLCFLFSAITVVILINAVIYSNISNRYRFHFKPLSATRPSHNTADIANESRTRDISVHHTFSNDDTNMNNTSLEKKRFPGCIIIGAKKGGTSAVGLYLDLHPDIKINYMGETHFFSRDSNYKRGLEYYRRLMPYTYPHQITIEKTPRYFVAKEAAKRIQEFNKTIKLIVTLRHPVKRVISDYWHIKRYSSTKTKINNAIQSNEVIDKGNAPLEELAIDQQTGDVNTSYAPINVSMYYIHLKHWLEYFPREQIHIVDGENLIVNPIEEIEQMESFLGLEHRVTNHQIYFDHSKGFYCIAKTNGRNCMSDGKGHVHPALDLTVYQKLMDFYEPLNEKLFSLVGRRFNWD